ncbi:MAG: NAD(+) diphosphatase [Rhizomicrobium sp.]
MIPYTGNPLDRKSDKRQDPAWVAAQRNHPDSLFLPMREGTILFAPDGTDNGLKPAFLPVSDYPALKDGSILLGMDAERALFAKELPTDATPGQNSHQSELHKGAPFSSTTDKAHAAGPDLPGQFVDLRRAAPFLNAADLAIAAEAKALSEWHRRNQFCGSCGHATVIGMGGHQRHCPHCGADIFPRIDPAVIVLVTHKDRCLLARNAKWEEGRFSTLAGFVEAGEGIEETVRREIMEEVGVKVTGVRYFASQPWPYPAALMLGFFADCENTDIHTDPAEIAEACWFTREEARALLEGTHPSRHGPMTTAIAYRLIHQWAYN